jgi:hypothetical protein
MCHIIIELWKINMKMNQFSESPTSLKCEINFTNKNP